MKYSTVLIAPDKFKGSLTAVEFCNIASEAARAVLPNLDIIACPLADGGEGSLSCFFENTQAEEISGVFTDANFFPAHASYALLSDIAFIELARTSGLYKTRFKNPMKTTTLGFGEQIKNAILHGAKTIYLAIGGSSTTDAGCGMACALGYTFLDAAGNSFVPVGETLTHIARILPPEENKNLLNNVRIITLCDVKNPLYGTNGAAHVYAAQKGASEREILLLDEGLMHFNNLCKKQGFDFFTYEGAGAAGGVGAGSVFFLNASLESGAEHIFRLVGLDKKIAQADLIITGEGKIDSQSKEGKLVYLLRERAKNIPLVAFCGESEFPDTADFLIIPINRAGESLNESLKNTPENLKCALRDFFKILK